MKIEREIVKTVETFRKANIKLAVTTTTQPNKILKTH